MTIVVARGILDKTSFLPIITYGEIIMKATFDLKNSNGRVYSQEQMKSLIDDFNVRLKEFDGILGELNHS